MAAPHYTPSGKPVQGSNGSSKDLRDEFALVETGIQVMNALPMTVNFEDINTAGSAYIVVPWSCKITKIYAVNALANTTNPTVLTPKIASVAVTGGGLTFGATDAEETVVSSTPTAANTVAVGGSIEIATDGGGGSVMPAVITLLLERT